VNRLGKFSSLLILLLCVSEFVAQDSGKQDMKGAVTNQASARTRSGD